MKNIHITTIGGVLRPSDEVLSIVPTGEKLIVEARIAPSDIATIKVGQHASVKFDAYDSSIYGSGEGVVSYLSPDTIVEQSPTGAVSFYRVHITVNTRTMKPRHPSEKIAIQPGMTVTAEILIGSNTVFRYLVKPLAKTLSQSMTER